MTDLDAIAERLREAVARADTLPTVPQTLWLLHPLAYDEARALAEMVRRGGADAVGQWVGDVLESTGRYTWIDDTLVPIRAHA